MLDATALSLQIANCSFGKMWMKGFKILLRKAKTYQEYWSLQNGKDDVFVHYSCGSALKVSLTIRLHCCLSARGDIPQVAGYAVGHEPSEEHIEGLTAKPFWATEDIPWAQVLEANSNCILDEFNSKITAGRGDVFAGDSAWQNQVMGSGWSAIRLQRLGVWNPENCLAFPHTFELLQSLQIPFAVRGVCFARQAPRSGVQPHSDGRNFILTAHLGLKIPKGCWIQVGESENKREWSEGKLTIIDTSFRHSTSNPTDEERHVLIIDFWHPELTDVERKALAFVYDTRNKFESGQVPFRMPRNGRRRNEPGSSSSWWRV